jgi:hypothetical protein
MEAWNADPGFHRLGMRLLRLGMHPGEVRALQEELSGHVLDTRDALMADGMDPREAEALAWRRVGSTDELEGVALREARRLHVAGRFPVLTVVFLPLAVCAVLLLGLIGAALLADAAAGLVRGAFDAAAMHRVVGICVEAASLTLGGLGALLISRFFSRSMRGTGWPLGDCLLFTALTFCFHITFDTTVAAGSAGTLFIGLSLPPRAPFGHATLRSLLRACAPALASLLVTAAGLAARCGRSTSIGKD